MITEDIGLNIATLMLLEMGMGRIGRLARRRIKGRIGRLIQSKLWEKRYGSMAKIENKSKIKNNEVVVKGLVNSR